MEGNQMNEETRLRRVAYAKQKYLENREAKLEYYKQYREKEKARKLQIRKEKDENLQKIGSVDGRCPTCGRQL